MKGIVFIIFYIGLGISSVYSQTSSNITLKEIRHHVDNIAASLESRGGLDKMYVNIDDNGERWVYLEDMELDGLRSDEAFVSLEYSEIIIKMIYHSITYNMEKPISFKSFTDILRTKSINGVHFRTKNNDFFFDYDEIIEKGKSRKNKS